jgi:AcrR family transcriptional regulator
MRVVSRDGLEGLSIGTLADSLGMSKSGLFAHFGSKDELQLEVLRTAAADFEELVIRPALKAPRGPERLRQMFENWIRWAASTDRKGGCIFTAASFELDDRPGQARDYVVEIEKQLLHSLAHTARLGVAAGAFRPTRLRAARLRILLFLGFHHTRRLLRQRGAEEQAARVRAVLADAARRPEPLSRRSAPMAERLQTKGRTLFTRSRDGGAGSGVARAGGRIA